VREALDVAQGVYVRQLTEAGAVMEYLSSRDIGPAEIETFGLGYAVSGHGSLKGRGIGGKLAALAGLVAQREDGSLREVFHDRITIPIHDARGRLVGFGGRVWPGRRGEMPKFVNSPDGPAFDKGRTLFNLHRAAGAARPAAENRLIVVEGYFDVISLSRAGIGACVAPMGTALTEKQLERCWRVHHRPILLFDGDAAGRKAAVRAAKLALPALGPGRELGIALLPDGKDPDDLAREKGASGIEDVIAQAKPWSEFLFDAVMRGEA
jgi:DNA primase